MSPFTSLPAEIIERHHEGTNIYTYRLRIRDEKERASYTFRPGQFNMLYLFGSGEIPISIASHPSEPEILDHTIRVVGSVSRGIANLKVGDTVGLRGPYGSGWPMEEAQGKNLIFITGGLGCAPVMGAILYCISQRDAYGSLKILHGVKESADLIYREKLEAWRKVPDTEVLLTADVDDNAWAHDVGVVTTLLGKIEIDQSNTLVMMCGPEVMMQFAVRDLLQKGLSSNQIYLSLERNMKCALGFCGHCQYGPHFVCRDGPVLRYDRVEHFFFQKEI